MGFQFIFPRTIYQHTYKDTPYLARFEPSPQFAHELPHRGSFRCLGLGIAHHLGYRRIQTRVTGGKEHRGAVLEVLGQLPRFGVGGSTGHESSVFQSLCW